MEYFDEDNGFEMLKSEVPDKILDSYFDCFKVADDPISGERTYFARCQVDPHYVLVTNAKVGQGFKIDKYVKHIATLEKYFYVRLSESEKKKIPFVSNFK